MKPSDLSKEERKWLVDVIRATKVQVDFGEESYKQYQMGRAILAKLDGSGKNGGKG